MSIRKRKKKKKIINNLRQQSRDDLKTLLEDVEAEVRNLRMQQPAKMMGGIAWKNVMALRNLKKRKARILTLLNERGD